MTPNNNIMMEGITGTIKALITGSGTRDDHVNIAVSHRRTRGQMIMFCYLPITRLAGRNHAREVIHDQIVLLLASTPSHQSPISITNWDLRIHRVFQDGWWREDVEQGIIDQ